MISHQIKTGFYHKSDRKWEKNYPFIIGKPNSIGNRRNWIGKQIVHVYLAISSSYPFWFCGIPIDLFMQKWSVLLKEKEKSWMTTVAERLSRHLMQSNDRWKLCSLSKFAIMHSPSFGSVFCWFLILFLISLEFLILFLISLEGKCLSTVLFLLL